MAKKKQEEKPGKMSIESIRSAINKSAGEEVAFDLANANPTNVIQWIPTGSRWLDSIICNGNLAGIPVEKISEIAGLESTGKSFLAAQAAANAQKMGIDVVYFDSESAISSDFMEKAGIDLEKLIYLQASSVEFVLETIEDLLKLPNQWLFIWDSLALTPSLKDIEGDFNPQSTIAVKPRILAKGFAKLILPLANAQATLLILNQLKTNITMSVSEAMTTPYITPGGKAAIYSYSLRIWLTRRKAKASFVINDKGYTVGTEVKAKIEKSRFGTQRRVCNFKILWGDAVGVQDEESWLDAVKSSKHIISGGAWYTMTYEDGSTEKFQASGWIDKLKIPKFRTRVIDIMDEELIVNFKNQAQSAASYYDKEETTKEENAES